MIYLALSILFSSVLYVIFKLFDRYNINTLQAIVVNYLVAGTTGLILNDTEVNISEITTTDWIPSVLIMGVLFISIFNLMAYTSQRNGLSVASVAGKMSLVIPVIVGFIAYNESVGLYKVLGIILALLAVWFTTTGKNDDNQGIQIRNLGLPILLFIGSGIIDTLMKHIERNYLNDSNAPLISASIFYCALSLGILVVLYNYFKNGVKFQAKSIVAGIVLGVPNYFSIVVLFKSLAAFDEASFVYPINHVGIVLLSTLFGLFLFKEKLKTRNWLGIGLAIIAIVLIAFAKA